MYNILYWIKTLAMNRLQSSNHDPVGSCFNAPSLKQEKQKFSFTVHGVARPERGLEGA